MHQIKLKKTNVEHQSSGIKFKIEIINTKYSNAQGINLIIMLQKYFRLHIFYILV